MEDESNTILSSYYCRNVRRINKKFLNVNQFHLDRGDWGPDEYCPDGAYAAGFQLYVAPRCTRRCQTDDDVALMGVK